MFDNAPSLPRTSSRLPSACLVLLGVLLFAGPLRALLASSPSAQDLRITEFSAANNSGEKDETGAYQDWIEIYNPNPAATSAEGWFLTDNAQNLSKWRLPKVTIPGQGFLVVFASGLDRSSPTNRLHTNFRLDRNGEYLALVQPDGVTIATAFAPAYPRQLADVSYGTTMAVQSEILVPTNAVGRLLIPTATAPVSSWAQQDFNDSAWTLVTLGVGYDRPSSDPTVPDPTLPAVDVTQPSDFIVATSGNSPDNEGVENAIDDRPDTKYLNFDKLDAGFTVTPSVGDSVVTGLRLTSANDAPERDPTTFVLFGSRDGDSFVEVARGPIPIFSGRFTPVEVAFTNLVAYKHYRLLFPTVQNANAAVAMQIAEVELLGRIGSTPTSLKEWIQSDLEASLYNRQSSVCLRIPFVVDELRPRPHLALRVRYDDGFIAFLNGVEIARGNVPLNLLWDSTALTNRSRAIAVLQERFDVSGFAQLLQVGTNILAFRALNDSPDSPDFLLQAELENSELTFGAVGYFRSATPGQPNGNASLGLVADVTATPQHGFYEAPTTVTLYCSTPGTMIRYTTNTTVPSPTNGLLYTSPIQLSRTTTLRAAAFREDWYPSRATTHSYLMLNDVITQSTASTLAAGFPTSWNGQAVDYGMDPRVVGQAGQDKYGGKYTRSIKSDLQAIPTMSLVMDMADMFGPKGIYSNPQNHGEAWERSASLELIYPDGRPGFQENAGVRIQGGAFRRFDLTLKKSFRIIFSEKYGSTTLRYPLFGEEAASEFNNFVLRANSNDGWPYFSGSCLYIRDAFAMETARAMSMVSSHSDFVHLYINGAYWGLYNPVERPDAAFSATYQGGDRDTWDAINQDSVPDGNYDAWNRMLSLLTQGVAKTEVYQRLQGNNPDGTRNSAYEDLLNVENLIDYIILNTYAGNTDWPHRNWWAGRDRNNGDGFHFYPWDTETALGITGVDVDVTGANGAVATPYAAARANADFRMAFADHVYRHFYNGGALYVNPAKPAWDASHPENNRPAARFAGLASRVQAAIVGESARWGDQKATGPFTRDEHWQKERDNLLTNFFPKRSAIVLAQYRRAGLYPNIDPPAMSQRGGAVPVGFQLSLSSSQGSIYYTTNLTDPRMPIETQEISRRTLVSSNTTKRVLIPSTANGGSQLAGTWQGSQEPFDDSAWTSGTGALGFDRDYFFNSTIGFNVRTLMDTKNTTAFVRIPFDYTPATGTQASFLALRVQYNDGFVAYLNGVKIASTNAPAAPAWNSTATSTHGDSASLLFEEFKSEGGAAALKTGRNILAIQGLNAALNSTEFLLGVELAAGESRNTTPTTNSVLLYTGPIVLNDLTTLKTRTYNGKEWSALNEATFVVGAPSIALSELHYHPAKASSAELAAGFSNADDFEFIELYNNGVGTFDLQGCRFITGIGFDFTGSGVTSLPAGRYVLVVKNRAAFELRYGVGLPVAGEYSGQLNNAGERIQLVNARSEDLLNFTYGTTSPWPQSPDGFGPSLEVRESAVELSSVSSWQASIDSGGSPGWANATAPLQITETYLMDGKLVFQFPGKATLGYTIYYRDSFAEDTWRQFQQGAPLGQDQAVTVSVDLPASPSARFFRISIP